MVIGRLNVGEGSENPSSRYLGRRDVDTLRLGCVPPHLLEVLGGPRSSAEGDGGELRSMHARVLGLKCIVPSRIPLGGLKRTLWKNQGHDKEVFSKRDIGRYEPPQRTRLQIFGAR